MVIPRMAPSFPLPRSLLPTVDVPPKEHAAAKHMMDTLLRHTVNEYDKFTTDGHGMVDNARWKQMTSQNELLLFRERNAGDMSASVALALEGGSLMPNRDAIGALAAPSMLMTGTCPGRLENTMYAVVTETHDDLALVVKFLHEDVADCALLSTMEPPTEENPHHFLGYKYFVRKSPTEGRMLKHRDSLYLEYCGYTTSRSGERLGFHLMHSVDLPEFPNLRSRNSIRALQSVRYLYRQLNDKTLEVFMLGNLDVSGMIVKPIANMFALTTLFGIARLPDCAEARRLTQMTKQRLHPHAGLISLKVGCAVCHGAKKSKRLLGSGMPATCHICGQLACPRCRTSKKVFVRDTESVLGKFHKVQVCTTCVLVANAGVTRELHDHHVPASATPSYRSSSSNSYSSYSSSNSRRSTMSRATLCQADRALPKSSSASTVSLERSFDEACDISGTQLEVHRRRVVSDMADARSRGNSGAGSVGSGSRSMSDSASSRASSASSSTQQAELYARLMELQKAAESAYHLTQQNGTYLGSQ